MEGGVAVLPRGQEVSLLLRFSGPICGLLIVRPSVGKKDIDLWIRISAHVSIKLKWNILKHIQILILKYTIWENKSLIWE